MNQIEAILPELVNDWSLILPINVLEALGEHCISNVNEQSLGYYCCCLSRLDTFSAGNTNSHDPHSNNLWLLRFAASLNEDQGLYVISKFILLKYPPEAHLVCGNDALLNFQKVFGVDEAIYRFPHAKRLFIENDLAV